MALSRLDSTKQTVRLYCVSNAFKNITRSFFGPYKPRAVIAVTEIFKAFPKDQKIDFYENLSDALMLALFKTKQKAPIEGGGENFYYKETYAVFAVDINLSAYVEADKKFARLSDMHSAYWGNDRERYYCTLAKTAIVEILFAQLFDERKYYQDKIQNTFQEKWDVKQTAYKSNVLTLLNNYNKKNLNGAVEFVRKIEKAESTSVFDLCYDEQCNLKDDSQYKKLLLVILDNLRLCAPDLAKDKMQKIIKEALTKTLPDVLLNIINGYLEENKEEKFSRLISPYGFKAH